MTKREGFSKTAILELPLPTKHGQIHYPDPEQARHFVRVTTNGARSFVFKKNSPKRGICSVTLAVAGTDQWTAVQARSLCRIASGLYEQGCSAQQIRIAVAEAKLKLVPGAEEEKPVRLGGVTPQEMLSRYVAERAHRLATPTKLGYQRILDTYLKDWRDRPMAVIDEDDVVKRFLSIESESRANFTFGVLSMLYEYGRGVRGQDKEFIVKENPCEVLSRRELWHKPKRRKDVIERHQLESWWQAVEALRNGSREMVRSGDRYAKGNAAHNADPETAADYLVFMLMTGLRRSEAAGLKWEDVDFRARFFTVRGTKNGTDHRLPLDGFLLAMLERRFASRDAANPKRAPFVFAGDHGPVSEPKRSIRKVAAASHVPFSSHTLRRSFATIGESLDISGYALKRLLNHTTSDVTGGYTVLTVERLREPMAKIEDAILKAAGQRKSAEVVAIERAQSKTPA